MSTPTHYPPPPGHQPVPPHAPPPQAPPDKPKSRKKEIAVATASGVALIIYWLLFGMGGPNDYTDQDLRLCEETDSEHCSSRVDAFRAQDLERAIFTRANISGLDMEAAVLRNSVFDSVIAEGTNLVQADFLHADLQNANLRGAILVEATFEYADLRNADLRGADLRGVDFRHTNLEGADLRNTLGGPACPESFDPNFSDRYLNRAHCNLPQEEYRTACCPPAFGSTLVEGMRACLQPWWQIIRDGQTQDYGVQGEPIYDDVLRIEEGWHICAE